MHIKLILIFIITLELCYAYLDPVSGTMIIQVIVAALAALSLTIKTYWAKIKIFLSKFKKK